MDIDKTQLIKLISQIEALTNSDDLIGIVKYEEAIYIGNTQKVEFIV